MPWQRGQITMEYDNKVIAQLLRISWGVHPGGEFWGECADCTWTCKARSRASLTGKRTDHSIWHVETGQ